MIDMPDIDELIRICHRERSIHPQTEWVDFYKLCLQSCYGAGHVLTSQQDVIVRIKSEYASMKQVYLPLIQPLRLKGDIARISLSILDPPVQMKYGINPTIDLHSLSMAFYDSSQQHLYDHDQWTLFWKQIDTELIGVYQPSPIELKEIDTLLAGDRIPSHSDLYKNTYDPHYRVIDTESLNQYLDMTGLAVFEWRDQ
ncbi:MAG: hypothetical protein FJ042_08615 [Candidatus Cloacimonetes bacterium]|nr:hypothetical protein [Candidatus Cloacimonadota bacterium]